METKNLNASVLSIGVINITTGKTKYDWSIYEQPDAVVYLAGNRLLFAAPGTFNIGDKVTMFDNDSGRKVKWGSDMTIKDMSNCIQEDVINMLFKNEYDYRPKRAFVKSKWSRKLETSFSVKGTY